MTSAQLINRSYSVPEASNICTSGKAIVPAGTVAQTMQDAYHGGAIPAGTKVLALTYSNAGFNGITVYCQILEGSRIGQRVILSAGLLDRF